MRIPRIKYVERAEDGGHKEGHFRDAEQNFQVMPPELVKSYNQMADTIEMLHRHWAQVVEAAWNCEGDRGKFMHELHLGDPTP